MRVGTTVVDVGTRVVDVETVAGATRTGAEVICWIGAGVPDVVIDVRVEAVEAGAEGGWKALEVLGMACRTVVDDSSCTAGPCRGRSCRSDGGTTFFFLAVCLFCTLGFGGAKDILNGLATNQIPSRWAPK